MSTGHAINLASSSFPSPPHTHTHTSLPSGSRQYEDYPEEGSKQSQCTGGEVEQSYGGGGEIQDTATEDQDRVKGETAEGDIHFNPNTCGVHVPILTHKHTKNIPYSSKGENFLEFVAIFESFLPRKFPAM